MCGHRDDKIPGVTKLVRGGDRFFVGRTEVGVVHVPCHTDGHVVYCVIGADAGGEDGLGGGGEGGWGGGGGGGGGVDRRENRRRRVEAPDAQSRSDIHRRRDHQRRASARSSTADRRTATRTSTCV